MKISITSGIYLNYPIPEIISKVAAAGYDGLDFWCGRPQIYRDDYSEGELFNFRKQLTELGLGVPSLLPAFYRYPHSLSYPNPKIRADSVNYMKRCIDNAAALGASIVLIVPGMSLEGQTTDEAWKNMLDCIDAICIYASQFDVRLGLEPVNHYVSDLVNTAADALRAIDELKHDQLGVVLDTGHVHLSEEPILDEVKILGDRLLQIHVNDNDGINQQNLVPGEGSFDFNALFSALSAEEFTGYLTAELAYHYIFNPDHAVDGTLDFMRALVA